MSRRTAEKTKRPDNFMLNYGIGCPPCPGTWVVAVSAELCREVMRVTPICIHTRVKSHETSCPWFEENKISNNTINLALEIDLKAWLYLKASSMNNWKGWRRDAEVSILWKVWIEAVKSDTLRDPSTSHMKCCRHQCLNWSFLSSLFAIKKWRISTGLANWHYKGSLCSYLLWINNFSITLVLTQRQMCEVLMGRLWISYSPVKGLQRREWWKEISSQLTEKDECISANTLL